MNDFLITNIVAGNVTLCPDTTNIGCCEIRSSQSDTPQEKELLKKSLKSNNESVNLQISMRISTIVSADTREEAIEFAINEFVTALDVWGMYQPIPSQNFYLCRAGFSLDLCDNSYCEHTHPQDINGLMFRRSTSAITPITFAQIASVKNDELGLRFKRFCHWFHNANMEKNPQIKLIFLWFALEAMVRKPDRNSGRGHSDNIIPYILSTLGMQRGNATDGDYFCALSTIDGYSCTRNAITTALNAIIEIRNSSVHNGFSPKDISPDHIKNYLPLLNIIIWQIKCEYEYLTSGDILKDFTVDDFRKHLFENLVPFDCYRQWFLSILYPIAKKLPSFTPPA